MSLQTDIKKITKFFAVNDKERELAYVDNPNSVFDNLARFTRLLMYVLIFLSSCIGIVYHVKLFTQNGIGEFGATIGSLLMFIFVEVLCSFFALNVFRSVFNGVAFGGLKQLVGIIIAMCFIGYGYMFKFGISADMFSAQNASSKKIELSSKYSNGKFVSQYDAQIANAQKTIDRAKSQTWQGKLTPKGVYLLSQGNTNMERLLALQGKEFAEYSKRDSLLYSDSKSGIEQARRSANNYGGIIEISLILCTIILPLFEMSSYDDCKKNKNKNGGDGIGQEDLNEEKSTPKNELPKSEKYVPFSINKDTNAPNINGRTQIGFNYSKRDNIGFEKKTNNEDENLASYYKKIIDSHQLLLDTEAEDVKKNYYSKIVNAHQILLSTL